MKPSQNKTVSDGHYERERDINDGYYTIVL